MPIQSIYLKVPVRQPKTGVALTFSIKQNWPLNGPALPSKSGCGFWNLHPYSYDPQGTVALFLRGIGFAPL